MPGPVADRRRSLGISLRESMPMSDAESVTEFESEPISFYFKSNLFLTSLECLILM